MPRLNLDGTVDSIEFSMDVSASNSFAVDVPPALGAHLLSVDAFAIAGGSPTFKVKAFTNEAQTAAVVLSVRALSSGAQTTVATPVTNVPTLLAIEPAVTTTTGSALPGVYPFGLKVLYVAGTSTGSTTGRIVQARP